MKIKIQTMNYNEEIFTNQMYRVMKPFEILIAPLAFLWLKQLLPSFFAKPDMKSSAVLKIAFLKLIKKYIIIN